MTPEDEAFHEMELRQQQEDISLAARKESEKFIKSHSDSMPFLSLRDAYELGYKHALCDAFVRQNVKI